MALVCAKVLLVPLVFDPRALIVFALPKALLAHAVGALLLGVLVAAFIRFGREVWRPTPIHLPIAALVAAYSLAAAFALDRNVALFGAHDRSLGLVTMLDNVLLYLAIVLLVRMRSDLVAVGVSLLAGVLLVTPYEIIQVLGLDPVPWASGFSGPRSFSTLGNAAVLAQYLGSVGVGALSVALLPPVPLPRYARIAVVAVGAIAVVGTILSGTRAAFIGFGAAGLVFSVVAIARAAPVARPRLAVLSGFAAALVIAVVLLGPAGGPLRDALASTEEPVSQSPETGSLAARVILYGVALQAVADRPILGVGPDNYVVAFPRYRPEGYFAALPTTAPETSTHSEVLRVATDAGLVGLACFAAVFVTATIVAIRRGAPPLAVSSLAALAFFFGVTSVSISDVGTEWLPWLFVGVLGATADTTATKDAPGRVHAKGKRGNWGRARERLAAVVLLVMLVAALAQIRALQAAEAAEASRQARGRGEVNAAASAAENAVALDPLRAEYWNGLGLSYAGAKRTSDAVRAFSRAVELAPYHVTYLGNLARAHLTQALGGDSTARQRALDTARRAVDTDPNNGEAHFTLALALQAFGRHAEAAAESERGLELYPTPRDLSVYEVAGRAYLDIAQPADAERWLRVGIPLMASRESVTARFLLVRALLAQSKTKEALAEIDNILVIDPNNQIALRLRSQLQGH